MIIQAPQMRFLRSTVKHSLQGFGLYCSIAAVLFILPALGESVPPQKAASQVEAAFLVTPVMKPETFLVSFPGNIQHIWPSKWMPSGPGRVDKEGALLRVERDHLPRSFRFSGGSGGRITKISWDGKEVWSYTLASPGQLVHHDAVQLPNGNVLALVWQRHEPEAAVAKGRDPQKTGKAGVWSECIWELKPLSPKGGRLVWQWQAWDHLGTKASTDQTQQPRELKPGECIDINGGKSPRPAWAGVKRMEYSPELDQVLLVAEGLGAVWIIDHSTTTAEAASSTGGKAGRGGNLLYQWSGQTPDQQEQDASYIVDAEWGKQEGSSSATIQVLRGIRKNGAVSYAVERWQLPRAGEHGYQLAPSGEYAAPTLLESKPLELSAGKTSALRRPSSFSDGMVTFGTAGIIRGAGGAGNSPPEYKNQEGMTTITVSKASLDSTVCCGGQAPASAGKPALPAQEPIKLTSAPVLKSRQINPEFLPTHPDNPPLKQTGKTLQPTQ